MRDWQWTCPRQTGPVRVLVVNAGSSSLKLAVLDDGQRVSGTIVEQWDGIGHLDPISDFLSTVDGVDAVGHRVVHGGARYSGPVVLTDEVIAELDELISLAPLHQPRSLAGIREVGRLLPRTPAVACFDTAFHATLPDAARTYALPREWNQRWGLSRYGFHGLSHVYAVRRAAEIIDRPIRDLRIVSCHLGAGASLAAVRGGQSVDTTMGFTPLAGLVMATRSGSLDPGLLLWLQQHGQVQLDALAYVLEHESGLKGLSGTSGDLRDVLTGRANGDADCALAFDVFTHRLRREIGAMAATAQGLDVLVMTGGIGEHSPEVRKAACAGLDHLGLAIDSAANASTDSDADISSPDAVARTVVITASEDTEIAKETQRTLEG